MSFLATHSTGKIGKCVPVNRRLNCRPAPPAKRKCPCQFKLSRVEAYMFDGSSSRGALLSMLLPADSGQHGGEVCFVASSLHNPSTSCSWLPLLMKTILKQECLFCILPTQWAETEGKAEKVRYVPSFVEKVCWLNHALRLLSKWAVLCSRCWRTC